MTRARGRRVSRFVRDASLRALAGKPDGYLEQLRGPRSNPATPSPTASSPSPAPVLGHGAHFNPESLVSYGASKAWSSTSAYYTPPRRRTPCRSGFAAVQGIYSV